MEWEDLTPLFRTEAVSTYYRLTRYFKSWPAFVFFIHDIKDPRDD